MVIPTTSTQQYVPVWNTLQLDKPSHKRAGGDQATTSAWYVYKLLQG